MPASVAMPAVRQNRSKLAPTCCQASSTIAAGATPAAVVDFVMALLSFADSAPRAYRLKVGNAYLTFSTSTGASPTAHRRLPSLGGSLRPQPSAADRVGREGGAQGRSCPDLATPHGATRRLRRLFYLQEYGAGCHLSRHCTKVRRQGPQLPDPRSPTQPLHPLLFLHPRRGARPDGHAGGLVLSVSDQLLPQRPQLHRTGAEARADRLPQNRQCLSRGRRRRRTADRGRQAQCRHHPSAARLLCRNFIFKRNFPIHKLFERSCELGLWRLTADKIAEIFGTRV